MAYIGDLDLDLDLDLEFNLMAYIGEACEKPHKHCDGMFIGPALKIIMRGLESVNGEMRMLTEITRYMYM